MPSIEGSQVRKLVIACDAGMGSSVLMANQLKKRLRDNGVVIEHSPIDAIPADADLVLTHTKLADRTRAHAGDRPVVAFSAFVGDPAVDGVVAAIHGGTTIDG